MKKHTNILAILTLVVLAAASACLMDHTYGNMFTKKDVRSFSGEKWQNTPGKRFMLLDDMLKKHDLKKMNRDEVISLLGQPSDKLPSAIISNAKVLYNKKSGIAVSSKNNFAYIPTGENSVVYLLNDYKMPEEARGLYIRFDDGEKVEGYAVIYFTT
jgi:hypothetical protein